MSEQNVKNLILKDLILDWEGFLTDEQLKFSFQKLPNNSYIHHQDKYIKFISFLMAIDAARSFQIMFKNNAYSKDDTLELLNIGIQCQSMASLCILINSQSQVEQKSIQLNALTYLSQQNYKSSNTEFCNSVFKLLKLDEVILSESKIYNHKFNAINDMGLKISFDDFQKSIINVLIENSVKQKNYYIINKLLENELPMTNVLYKYLVDNKSFDILCHFLKHANKKKLYTNNLNLIFNITKNINENHQYEKEIFQSIEIFFDITEKWALSKNEKNIFINAQQYKQIINFCIYNRDMGLINRVKSFTKFEADVYEKIIENLYHHSIKKLSKNSTVFIKECMTEIFDGTNANQLKFVKMLLQAMSENKKGKENLSNIKKIFALSCHFPWFEEKLFKVLPSIEDKNFVSFVEHELLKEKSNQFSLKKRKANIL